MAKMGRPRKELDWKEFEQLCLLQCTMIEMCEWMHVSEKTLILRIKEHYNETFSSVFERKRAGGKISLRRNMMRMSEKQPAIAIFLAKNWLSMSDKQEIEHSGNIGKDPSELSDEELAAIIENRRGRGTTKEAEGT